jgi:hypothetical protein
MGRIAHCVNGVRLEDVAVAVNVLTHAAAHLDDRRPLLAIGDLELLT